VSVQGGSLIVTPAHRIRGGCSLQDLVSRVPKTIGRKNSTGSPTGRESGRWRPTLPAKETSSRWTSTRGRVMNRKAAVRACRQQRSLQQGNRPLHRVSLTNTRRDFPFHVSVPEGLEVTGVVMVEQVRSLDYRPRCKRIGPRLSRCSKKCWRFWTRVCTDCRPLTSLCSRTADGLRRRRAGRAVTSPFTPQGDSLHWTFHGSSTSPKVLTAS